MSLPQFFEVLARRAHAYVKRRACGRAKLLMRKGQENKSHLPFEAHLQALRFSTRLQLLGAPLLW